MPYGGGSLCLLDSNCEMEIILYFSSKGTLLNNATEE